MFLTIAGPMFVAFATVVVVAPVIIKVAELNHIFDKPDSSRKWHHRQTPTLGGVAIFAGTVFSFSFFNDYLATSENIKFMTSALILLFFAGVNDDIFLLTPVKKLVLQMACAFLITVLGRLYLTNLWGMFEISEISPAIGIFITFFAIVSLINAFNLIDGIDGLASGLGLISCLCLGFWFFLTNAYSLSILSFALSGALMGFLIFNFHQAKIFMGDTGSMMIGFIIAILAIKFIENNRIPGIENSPFYIKAAPGVAFAIVMIPLVDMARVFLHRILLKKNPLNADRRHIHHILLEFGLKQEQISMILFAASMCFIGLSLILREMRSLQIVLILSTLDLLMTGILLLILRFKK
jgi:UDP-N-acetylmuramyl pentapeptide phosphotransferase/UDP-N-acetylglucosamine-1-phosphate transferase